MGISIGLVGLGSFGTNFADSFKAHPSVSRIAYCDREPERVKKIAEDPFMKSKFNPKDAYFTLDDICKADLDAIVIMTQPWLHAPQCIQALKSGKHVMSAVPIISIPDSDETIEWCDRLVNTVKETGKQYMLMETSFYHPEMMFLRRKSKEGAFGKFISAECEYSHDYSGAWGCNLLKVAEMRKASKAGMEWSKTFHEKYISRGILGGSMHYPTHSVSGPCSIMNAHAIKVSALGLPATGYNSFGKYTAFVNTTGFFHMSNGATITAREYREITGHGYEINVYGTNGTWRNREWMWTKREYNKPDDFVPEHGRKQMTPEEMRDTLPREVQKGFILAENHFLSANEVENMDFTPKGHYGSHSYLVHEFIDSVEKGRIPEINVWEAARYVAMGAMAHKSALKDGELLDMPDWGDAPVKA